MGDNSNTEKEKSITKKDIPSTETSGISGVTQVGSTSRGIAYGGVILGGSGNTTFVAPAFTVGAWTPLITASSGTSVTTGTSSNTVSFGTYGYSSDQETIRKTWKLEKTIVDLRREANDLAKETQRAKASAKEKEKASKQFQANMKQLLEKQQLGFLLRGVNENAQKLLLKSDEFRKKFLETPQCNAFIMSIDIRRSTELMSKARSPQQFAIFMTTLCTELESVIKKNYGVVDKFTGDGVLAFFPDFYSGKDAGFYVVSVADQCHKIFEEKYSEFRSSFISVLKDVGLGIGIDYGTSYLVQIAGGLTVVGAPVVYACRMSGAPAATTLLNQPGYEKISERFSSHCFFQETEIEIKSEGKTIAYKVQLNGKEYSPLTPTWSTKNQKLARKKHKQQKK
jgi:class 3 adenylate cyclase